MIKFKNNIIKNIKFFFNREYKKEDSDTVNYFQLAYTTNPEP